MRVARSLMALAPAALLALAACGDASEDAAPVDQAAPAPGTAPSGLTEDEAATLESRDCRVVAEAYLGAIRERRWDYAARFWDDPVVDDARLSALFADYQVPDIRIADIQEEGAAGTLYCTVTGALGDARGPENALREGKVVFERANDIPGASAEQLRWKINESTFVEEMQRSGRGQPA